MCLLVGGVLAYVYLACFGVACWFQAFSDIFWCVEGGPIDFHQRAEDEENVMVNFRQ